MWRDVDPRSLEHDRPDPSRGSRGASDANERLASNDPRDALTRTSTCRAVPTASRCMVARFEYELRGSEYRDARRCGNFRGGPRRRSPRSLQRSRKTAAGTHAFARARADPDDSICRGTDAHDTRDAYGAWPGRARGRADENAAKVPLKPSTRASPDGASWLTTCGCIGPTCMRLRGSPRAAPA